MRNLLYLICSIAVTGCGASAPPPELVGARSAYEEAQEGQAPELVPDRLLEAQQALDVAEREFEEEGGTSYARALAYVAHRKAQIAVAMAEISSNKRIREQVEEDYQRELEIAQKKTRERLGMTKSQLDKTRVELSHNEKALSEKERALLEREQQLAEREKQLAEERKRREEAEEKAAAALASLEEIANVKEDQRGLVITLSGAVLFKSGDSRLLPIAERQLDKVAEALKEQDETKAIRVEGHTDSRGSARTNRRLSQERAESVRSYLVSQGVEPTRIIAVGRGEDEPIANNRTADGRANNRRVEIIVGNPES